MEVGYADAIAEEREEKRVFSTGAKRSNDVDHIRYDLIPHVALRRLAERYGMGAEKYGDHNYLKGIPYSVMINHIQNHLENFKRDRCTRDDNLAAIAWGVFSLMAYEALSRTDLDDLLSFDKTSPFAKGE